MADGEKTFDEMSQELVALCQQGTLGLKQRSQGIGRFNGIFFRTRGLQTVQDTDPHSVWVSSNSASAAEFALPGVSIMPTTGRPPHTAGINPSPSLAGRGGSWRVTASASVMPELSARF